MRPTAAKAVFFITVISRFPTSCLRSLDGHAPPVPSGEPASDLFVELGCLLREELAATSYGTTPQRRLMFVDTAENHRDGALAAEPLRRFENDAAEHGQVVIVPEPFLQLLQPPDAPMNVLVHTLDEPHLVPVVFDPAAPCMEPHFLGPHRRRVVHRLTRAPVSTCDAVAHR